MTEEKKSMVPKLRFPEFTETWEQRKFQEITQRVSTSSISSIDFPSVEYEDIEAGSGTLNKDVKVKDKNKKGIVFDKNDILFGKLRPYLMNWLLADFKGVAVGDFWVLRSQNFDPKFVYSLIQTKSFQEVANRSSGSKMPRADWNLVSNTLSFVPSQNNEQRKIGEVFSSLDKVITLHQRKLDVLNKLKKYLLQKMFPENGQLIPELRFPAFSGAWEQRKLSEIVRMNARIGWQNLRQSEFLDDVDFLLITGTDFKNGRVNFGTCHYIAKERFDQDPKIQVEEGSILLTKDGTIGKVALVDKLSKPATLNAGVYNIVPKNRVVESRFLFQYLSAPFLLDYVNKAATGGTIKHLNQSILVDFPVSFPSVAEQEKIGKFLEGIDHVTTLHQRKLEGLRKLKKSLLQQMFV